MYPGSQAFEASKPPPIPAVVKVMHELGARARLRDFVCLDVFAGKGIELKEWIRFVDHVDAWDCDAERLGECNKAVPRANMVVCDSYFQMSSTSRSHIKKYNLIMIDNNMMQVDHVEHFDLFPHIFNWLDLKSAPAAYLVMNVISDPNPYYKEVSRSELLKNAIRCSGERMRFYDYQSEIIPWTNIIAKYKVMAADAGLVVSWHHLEKRNRQGVHYLALEIKRR